jgi:hypothetical protein
MSTKRQWFVTRFTHISPRRFSRSRLRTLSATNSLWENGSCESFSEQWSKHFSTIRSHSSPGYGPSAPQPFSLLPPPLSRAARHSRGMVIYIFENTSLGIPRVRSIFMIGEL